MELLDISSTISQTEVNSFSYLLHHGMVNLSIGHQKLVIHLMALFVQLVPSIVIMVNLDVLVQQVLKIRFLLSCFSRMAESSSSVQKQG